MQDTRVETELRVEVRAVKTNGKYEFAFSGEHFNAKGDWDFRKGDIAKKKARMIFTLSADSPAGLRFLPDGKDAFWAQWVGETGPAGCPKGPYDGKGQQFGDYAVSADGRTLTVRNRNSTRQSYRYALRFSEDGTPVDCDPGGSNGGDEGPP